MKTTTRRILALAVLALCSLLLPACITQGTSGGDPPIKPEPAEFAIPVLRGFGDAVVRTYGMQALQKYAKEAIPLLDTDGDGVVTLAECEALVTAGSVEELQQRFLWLGLMAAAIAAAKD